ncbi:YcgJ family protein [Verminephrobacter eiseniae]|uniref:YcgJ family protein n=1 Tax=Verminephrobacter eiseniae TaxID=364317 RepID=UPI0022374BFE|nr:YcgJ family protein [Verminephrobacter eiseniae]MCW5238684.1 hypothetical protein [Verminephrobacter eiseniae]
MNPARLCCYLALLLAVSTAHAGRQTTLRSPAPGVLCDRHLCANGQGISRPLTEKHLGPKTATKLFSQGEFDLTEFSFANGVFCDVKERLCRQHRYYGADGQRSGAVNKKYTRLLFGQ